MDEPISLRQRLWLDCYLGQDWIRGFASAYFDYDPAVRDWTDDPVYHRNFLADGRMQFTPRYQHYRAYGFNFAKGFEKATIRGELAVKPGLLFSIDPDEPTYKKDSDGLVSRDLYQSVIGIDRTFFTKLCVNLQFFTDLIEDGQESLALKRKTHGLTFEISDKFLNDDLWAGFRGMCFTSNDGSAFEIFAKSKIGDNWQIAPCYMLFNGPKDSRLGQFGQNDMVYFRLRYSF